MENLSPARARLALLALALGGFSIGSTEFVAMGLLPDIARDLLPEPLRERPGGGDRAGRLAHHRLRDGRGGGRPHDRRGLRPLPAQGRARGARRSAFTRRHRGLGARADVRHWWWPRGSSRGLPHGAYFGVAALVAAQLLGPEKRGQAVAYVLVGLTIASVVGVPLITYLGQHAGWRAAYLVVAALFALTTVALIAFIPAQPGDPHATIRRELRRFTRPAVWCALLTASLGLRRVLRGLQLRLAAGHRDHGNVASRSCRSCSWCWGSGTTVGILGGGQAGRSRAPCARSSSCSARSRRRCCARHLRAHGAGPAGGRVPGGRVRRRALAPAIQTRLMDVAGDSQTLAAAVNHSALNIGNSLGAFLGGAVIAAGWGYLAPTWLGLALVVPGVTFALAGWSLTRRDA